MGKLTGRVFSSGASVTDLIHIVKTGDTSQSPSGSSYKAEFQDYANLILGLLPQDIYVTGGTYSAGIATLSNNTGGTFTITGFSTGTTSFDVYVTGATYDAGITTYTNNTGGTFTVDQRFKSNITVVLNTGDSVGKYHNTDVIPSYNKDIEWILNDIATDFIPPTFSTFTRSNFSTPIIVDLGVIIPNGSQTFTWATTTPNNINPTTLTLTQNISSTVIGTGLNHLGGSDVFTTTDVIISNTPIENKVIYTISGINNKAGVFSKTLNASWRYRWYYGKSSLPNLTSPDVVALSNSNLVVGVTNSFVNVGASTGSYIYLIIPVGVGQPSDFRDSVSGCFGNNIPFTNLGTVTVTAFSVTTTYNKYRSVNTIDGSISIWMCA